MTNTEALPREVVSFVRRGRRMTISQRQWLAELGPRYLVEIARLERRTAIPAQPAPDWGQVFGRPGDLIAEIGPGYGEALTLAAGRHPDTNYLGFEVFEAAIGASLGAFAQAGLSNVRLVQGDGSAGLTHLIAPGSLAELWVFFPDPWPKARHHKRRLINPAFAELAASRLRLGGVWRLATDWADYAQAMTETITALPQFEFLSSERFADRPLTKYETRGIRQGRGIHDLAYRRTDA